MADRPFDTPSPGSLGFLSAHGSGSSGGPTPAGGSGGSTGFSASTPQALGQQASQQPSGHQAKLATQSGVTHGGSIAHTALAALVAMLDAEPAVGLAIIDAQGRALHANRRFLSLTVVVQPPTPPSSTDPSESESTSTKASGGDATSAERASVKIASPRKGVWARVGPDAVARVQAQGRPVVLHYIHDGRQVQCDIWPLPDGAGREPLFVVLAVEGRFDPAEEGRLPGSASSASGQARERADAEADGQLGARAGAPAAQAVEAKPGTPSERFITMSSTLAEMGDLSELTARELEVLALIGQGLATREIAEALGRSPRTIERHCDAIHKKLGTSNRVQMARYAMRAGLTVEAGKLKKV